MKKNYAETVGVYAKTQTTQRNNRIICTNMDGKQKNKSYTKTATPTFTFRLNFQLKKRAVTQPIQKETVPNHHLRTTLNKLNVQNLKEQFYLINLCKKLQSATFKFKNLVNEPSAFYYESATRMASVPKQSRQRQLKSIKRTRNTLRVNKEIALNERQSLKKRMEALETNLPFFRQ